MKWNSPQNTPHRRKTLLLGWEVHFQLCVVDSVCDLQVAGLKRRCLTALRAFHQRLLMWCQNSLLRTPECPSIYTKHTGRSATSLLFTASCHTWCSISTRMDAALRPDDSGLNKDNGPIQLLWLFVFSYSTVRIEVELSMPGICNETYLLCCLKNSVIWLHANWYFPNKESRLPRWPFFDKLLTEQNVNKVIMIDWKLIKRRCTRLET